MKTKRRTINRKKQRKLKKYRPTISKSTAQRIHAKRKFMKRVGIELTPELRRALSTKILTRDAELIHKQSNRISIYDVNHTIDGKRETFRLVFDKMRKNIVTILNNLNNQDKEIEIERNSIRSKQNTSQWI